MAGTTMFYINPEKLKQEFQKRNLSYAEVAGEIGITGSAISQALKRKSMAKAWAAIIDHCFRIPPESYDFNNKGGGREESRAGSQKTANRHRLRQVIPDHLCRCI